jgi:hypothetical protein
VGGEPAGHELGVEPPALRLAGLALGEEAERSEQAQFGARRLDDELPRTAVGITYADGRARASEIIFSR